MKRPDELRYIRMPIPNPDNEYVNYTNQLETALHFEPEALRELYLERQSELFELLEAEIKRVLNFFGTRRSRQFPRMKEMTGEWYIGRVMMYEVAGPSVKPVGDLNGNGENKTVCGSILTRFPGYNPCGGPNPVIDYLGIEFSFLYDAETGSFTFDSDRIYRLYKGTPDFFEGNVPKDSILCPNCHATGIDMRKCRQAQMAGKRLVSRRTTGCEVCGGFGYVTPRMERISFKAKQKALHKSFVRLMFLPVFLPFLCLIAAFLVLLLALHPAVLTYLTAGAGNSLELLRGYSCWYLTLLLAPLAGCLILAAVSIISIRHTFSIRSFGLESVTLRIGNVFLNVIFCAMYILLSGLMIISEDVPGLWRQSREDIAQITSGELNETTVWLSPKARAYRLPGPYTEGQPEPVTRYGGLGEETGWTWDEFYIPDCLEFSLDQDALFDETQSVAWNKMHAQQYQITYTENFHLVVSVTLADTENGE